MTLPFAWPRLAAVALGAVLLLLLLSTRLPSLLARTQAAAGPRVVASTSVLADLVEQVGHGRLAAVRSVVPAGVDVEDYDPKPEDLQGVAQANVLVMNGLALDRWVPGLVQSANPGLTTLVLSNGLPLRDIGA